MHTCETEPGVATHNHSPVRVGDCLTVTAGTMLRLPCLLGRAVVGRTALRTTLMRASTIAARPGRAAALRTSPLPVRAFGSTSSSSGSHDSHGHGGHDGHGGKYGNFHPHPASPWHTRTATFLGALLWFWVFYRASEDGAYFLVRMRKGGTSTAMPSFFVLFVSFRFVSFFSGRKTERLRGQHRTLHRSMLQAQGPLAEGRQNHTGVVIGVCM